MEIPHRPKRFLNIPIYFGFLKRIPEAKCTTYRDLMAANRCGHSLEFPKSRRPDCMLMVGTMRDNLLKDPNHRFYQNLSLLLAFFLVLFGGIWWLADLGIRKPTLSIAHMVGKLGLGDLSARILGPFPRGEIGGLMTVLNSTAEALERQRADIA